MSPLSISTALSLKTFGDFSKQMIFKLQCVLEFRKVLLKRRFLDPNPAVSESVSLGYGLGICISNYFPFDMGVWSQDHTLRTTVLGIQFI